MEEAQTSHANDRQTPAFFSQFGFSGCSLLPEAPSPLYTKTNTVYLGWEATSKLVSFLHVQKLYLGLPAHLEHTGSDARNLHNAKTELPRKYFPGSKVVRKESTKLMVTHCHA